MNSSLARVNKTAVWGFTNEINIIANFYNICIICHTEADNVWSASTPRGLDVNDCVHFIVIRNKGSKGKSKYNGRHFIALARMHFNLAREMRKSVPIKRIQAPLVKCAPSSKKKITPKRFHPPPSKNSVPAVKPKKIAPSIRTRSLIKKRTGLTRKKIIGPGAKLRK